MVPEGASGVKSVLVVTYYFPPSGGSGVQRVLKFVKYLRDFGYEPTVLTVKEGAYPQHDEELVSEIPPGVAIHRTRSLDPFGVYARLTGRSRKDAVMVGTVRREGGFIERAASWVRANIFLPDARVGWVPFAAREGIRLHRKQPFDVVFTSGPPHSVHLIGKKLKRRAGIPWVADFRDLWSDTNFYDELPLTAAARRRDLSLERSVLTQSDRVTTVSPDWKEVLLGKSRRTENEISVVYNGFDESDFSTYSGSVKQNPDVFTIAHVGSLYASRDPKALWAALKQLRQKGKLEHLRVRLVGTVGQQVRESILYHGLEDVVEFVDYVSHSEAVHIMCEAAALLLVIEPFQNDAGMITGKLYEYVASGSPVLAIGPPGGDAANLLDETNAGRLFASEDVQAISDFLLDQYERWVNGEPIMRSRPAIISRYARSRQTGQLADVFNSVINSN